MPRQFLLLLSLLFCLLIPQAVQAQKPKPADFGISSKKALNYYLEGLQLAQYRDRLGAIDAFSEAVKLEPEFAHAHYHLGVNAYVQKKYPEALEHLEKTYTLNPEPFRNLGYMLGMSYFFNAQYDNSVPLLREFLETRAGRPVDLKKAAVVLRHAQFAAEAIKTPVDFEPVNLGPAINSERDEYLPFLTADESYLLFTSRRPSSVGGYNRSLSDYSEDFFFSTLADTGWQEAVNLGTPINTTENEGAASITQDGNMIFFTACNLPGGIGNCDIYFSTRAGKKWSRPELVEGINSEFWDSQPCLSDDGKTLYFASNRQLGVGGRDIWFATKTAYGWSEPQNMGKPVNSEGNEDSPFLHADGITLYFSSDFHPGFGAQDLFVSYQQKGQWTEPQNLGYPLNTIADESNIFVNASGRQGYINSDRAGGLGKSDLYRFDMDDRNRPQIATFLRGITRDSITHTPVPAFIRLVDLESGDTIRQVPTGRSDGRFLMTLPLERSYAAFVTAKGYLFASKNFYLKDLPGEKYFDLTIEMAPLRKDVQVVLQNIFFEIDAFTLEERSEAELQFLLTFMQDNPKIRIEIQGHTDDIGTEEYNLDLSQKRANEVMAYLIERGLEPSRVEAKGYGEKVPVSGNITAEDRAQNRRTEFKILETGL